MEMYLVKSAVILTILYGFYKLVLENESMHIFKRFYLLGSLPAAFLIPLITFTSYVEVPVSSATLFVNNSLPMPMPATEVSVNIWPFVLWGLYALGVVFFTIKFGKNLIQLISKIKNNPKFTRDSINHILLKTPVFPHTFLNYVFLNKQKFEANEIPEEVIAHEHIHAKQKHSIDILLVELLQIVIWFNPLLYFLKRSIKLNHEFLADRAVLSRGTDTVTYQNILLAFSSHATTPTLANSINYSFIKKRFTVMKKQTSTKAIWLRSLLLAPLLGIIFYGFSSKEVIQKEVIPPQEKTESYPSDEGHLGAPLLPPISQFSDSNRDRWVKDFDDSFQQEKAPSQSKSIIFKINDDESFSINGIPSSLENYKPTLKSLITKFENLDSDEEIKVFVKSENLVKLSFINEIGEELKKYNIVTIQVTSGILDDRNEKIKRTPPTPPTPPNPKVGTKSPLPLLPATPPPAPMSDSIEYIKALHKSGAVFFIGPHQYNYEEVLEMAKKSDDLNIDVSEYPKVHLLGC